MTDQQWQTTRIIVGKSLQGMIGQIRTPGMQETIRRFVEALAERADKPTEYIAEAVEDARHDLMLIAGLCKTKGDDE
jgi:hypothetical protein